MTRSLILLIAILAGALGICCAQAERKFTAEDREWWAVQPVRDPAVPADAQGANAVDAFINRKLDAANLARAEEAGPLEFVRRAYFDLHGLPPTPSQQNTFVAKWKTNRESAITGLIDELLTSPRYGERWAQHWLDVVRYAETDGYREDAFRPDAHRYRDYVVRAFNSDKPYDQFVREQLAADEFAAHDPLALEATGFLRLGIYEWNQRNAEMQRELMLNEITNLTGEVFLGIGIGCARCHDHKFDPILQRDYFALQAFLSSTCWPDDRKLGSPDELKEYAAWDQLAKPIRDEMDSLMAEARRKVGDKHVRTFPPNVQAMYWKPQAERTSYEQQIAMLVQRQVDREEVKVSPSTLSKDLEKYNRYKVLRGQLMELNKREPRLPTAFISTDTGTQPAVTYLGDGEKKTVVEPAFLTLLGSSAPEIAAGESTTGRRRALAEWIGSTQNPLAARVAVNRIWQHHFSKGLAASANDFGTLGEPPSHPELLDWLASRFVEGGWRIKAMHRLIMTSDAYRQTARREPGRLEKMTDNGNRLLWRYPPQRLSAEQVRDAMLAVSGELKHRVGGASVEANEPHRSLYVKKIRNTPEPFLHSFDAPVGFDSAPDRQLTTTPTQALLLANNEWPMQRARSFAERLLGKRTEITDGDFIVAYRLAWGRDATQEEVRLAREFVNEQVAELHDAKPPSPPDKFPNENGLRPIAQRFSGAKGVKLGAQALWLQPGSRFERLRLGDVKVENNFTIEAVVQLDSVKGDARVNPILARWDGKQNQPGWSFGVTSKGSSFGERNLILELTGANPDGAVRWEAVASGLRLPLGNPVFVAAAVEFDADGRGHVRFVMKDLTKPQLDPLTAQVGHRVTNHVQRDGLQIVVGGRDQPGHLWDGQIASVAFTDSALPDEQLKIFSPDSRAKRVFHWTFSGENGEQPVPGSSWIRANQPQVAKPSPTFEAMVDFCHALLSSNEFLYLH